MKRRGDTLIEVLFAFAILATIVGFSFTGALSGYKSALAAQNRTQATFLAQYQADGLKTYRDSLQWETSDDSPSFLDTTQITCIHTKDDRGTIYWEVIVTAEECKALATALAPNLDSPDITIKLENVTGNPDRKVATVVVSWQPRNARIREQVTNTIILTKEQ